MSDGKYEHRKSRLTVILSNPDGSPAVNQPVSIDQTRHQFLFGTSCFELEELVGGNRDGTPISPRRKEFLQDRMEKITALLNYATLPFYLGRYEPEEGNPDKRRMMSAAKWLKDRNVLSKGHPLCWHTMCANWLMNYSNEDILRRQLERIDRDVATYKGDVDIWDVINEVVIMPIFDKYDNAITRICKELGRASIVREVFNSARKANPGATLVINDFNVSANYEILIDGCLQSGAPIDVIGIQSHQHQGYWGLEKINEVLERFSHFGKPLHFTENTIISGDIMPSHITDLNDWQVPEWPSTPEGEDRQARETLEMYEALFAHPSVEAITFWDPADGMWLGAPAGIIRKDNSIKPVYEALMEKIKGDWWTRASLATNEAGEIDFCGFRGDYRIRSSNGTANFTLSGKDAVLNLTLSK
ncbi:MAG: endo-1,4-beta-xylanase [Clostridiales bacterium]|jgi:GH35 family endo-1,4-beta-xylanase|nr:endo-1,4-beta-xylanase [Clostridiales bacterium]